MYGGAIVARGGMQPAKRLVVGGIDGLSNVQRVLKATGGPVAHTLGDPSVRRVGTGVTAGLTEAMFGTNAAVSGTRGLSAAAWVLAGVVLLGSGLALWHKLGD